MRRHSGTAGTVRRGASRLARHGRRARGQREQGVRVLDRSRVRGSARPVLVSAAADTHASGASLSMGVLVVMPLVAIRAYAVVATASGRMECLIACGLSSRLCSWTRGQAFGLVPEVRLLPFRRFRRLGVQLSLRTQLTLSRLWPAPGMGRCSGEQGVGVLVALLIWIS